MSEDTNNNNNGGTSNNDNGNSESQDKTSSNYNSFDGNDIDFNEGLLAIRIDPGVYLDSMDSRAIMHLLYECADNIIDESNEKGAPHIIGKITIRKDGVVIVEDNARGIPTGMNEKRHKLACYIAIENVHGGSKLRNKKKNGKYMGTHGIGLSAVAACSRYIKVTIKRDGVIKEFKYEAVDTAEGVDIKRTQDLTVIGSCPVEETGTRIEFLYDDRVLKLEHPSYGTVKFPYIIAEIKERLENYMLFNKNVELLFDYDTPDQGAEKIHYTKEEYSQDVVFGRYTNGKYIKDSFESGNNRDLDVETKFGVSADGDTMQKSTANGLFLKRGGTHVDAFKQELMQYVLRVFKDRHYMDLDYPLYESDILRYASFIIEVSVQDPQFSGQVKNCLEDVEVGQELAMHYEEFFNNCTSRVLTRFIKVVKDNYKDRVDAEKSQKAKKATKAKKLTEKEKLAFASSVYTSKKNHSICYFVEGHTAGIAIGDYRDKDYVTICEIQGKLLNYRKKGGKVTVKNNKVYKLQDDIQFKKQDSLFRDPKYDDYVMASDADEDGMHIRALWINNIMDKHRYLIEQGRVYIAEPPLYRVEYNGKTWYYYSAEEMHDDLDDKSYADKAIVTRFKGIGEMTPAEIMDKLVEHPKLYRVVLSDKEHQKEELDCLNSMMGISTKDRRKLVLDHFAGQNLIAYEHHYKELDNETRNYIDPLNPLVYLEGYTQEDAGSETEDTDSDYNEYVVKAREALMEQEDDQTD